VKHSCRADIDVWIEKLQSDCEFTRRDAELRYTNERTLGAAWTYLLRHKLVERIPGGTNWRIKHIDR